MGLGLGLGLKVQLGLVGSHHNGATRTRLELVVGGSDRVVSQDHLGIVHLASTN